MTKNDSRREIAIRRRQRGTRRWGVAGGGLGLLVLALLVWAIAGSAQRAALARAAETRPPVAGTPVSGGHNMALIPPTPVPPGPGPQPNLLLPHGSYDFGAMPVGGAAVEHSMRLLNTGDADLRVAGLATSCGCTTARLSADRIPPGESAELVVRYDPATHPQAGFYTREIYIYSNDPRQPKATFVITATTR